MNKHRIKLEPLAAIVVACVVGASGALFSMVASAAPTAAVVQAQTRPSHPGIKLDRSGRKQVGMASFYASRYSGKTMADGTPMRLYSNNAASLTLPLGTTARVANLRTGRSALVTIRDRGPYVHGRIIDLSPATARLIGISNTEGLGKVEVTPIAVPLADGTVWQKQRTIARN